MGYVAAFFGGAFFGAIVVIVWALIEAKLKHPQMEPADKKQAHKEVNKMSERENMITIKAKGLSPDEKKELHDIVRKIARKRRKGMKTSLMYELNFDETRINNRISHILHTPYNLFGSGSSL